MAFSGYYGIDMINQWIVRFINGGLYDLTSSSYCPGIEYNFFSDFHLANYYLDTWKSVIKTANIKPPVDYAKKNGKPLLVIGGPWGVKAYRRLFDKPAHGNGDVCLDIDRRALEGHPCAVVASCTDIPFGDKSFGAIFSSHVLEHMPTTQMAEQALAEMNRVAGSVFIAYPSRQSIAAWIIRDHHIWVWQKGGKTLFKQRKDRVPREHHIVKTADKIG